MTKIIITMVIIGGVGLTAAIALVAAIVFADEDDWVEPDTFKTL